LLPDQGVFLTGRVSFSSLFLEEPREYIRSGSQSIHSYLTKEEDRHSPLKSLLYTCCNILIGHNHFVGENEVEHTAEKRRHAVV